MFGILALGFLTPSCPLGREGVFLYCLYSVFVSLYFFLALLGWGA